MTAFATATDLGTRLKRTFTEGDEADWINELLADASGFLRSVIEQEVFPRTTSTYTAYPTNGREDLPQWPIISVQEVRRHGAVIPHRYEPGFVIVEGDDPCQITFTWGYATAPRELTRLACVLVSGTLTTLEAELGLTAGGLSSAQIDDFRLAWADAGEQSGMSLTEHTERRIRKQFGRGDIDVSETRG